MASYVIGTPYLEYLQGNAFVKDINDNIKQVSERSIEKISDNLSLSLVATSEQLAQSFNDGIGYINDSLGLGMSIISDRLEGIEYAIEELNASFDFSLSLVIHQLEVANKLNEKLISKLDSINNTLNNPKLTQAREYYRMGCDRLKKGLLDKALDSFIKSLEYNDIDFFTEMNIGKLFLYGMDEDDNVINLQEAEKHLLNAIRFGKAEIKHDIGFGKLTAEALLHLSFCILANLGNLSAPSNNKKIEESIVQSNKYLLEAIKINPEFSIAYYQLASNYANLKDPINSINYLTQAINQDKNYALKVAIDKNFDAIRKIIDSFIIEKISMYIERYERLQIKVLEKLEKYQLWKPNETEIVKYRSLLDKTKIGLLTKTYYGVIVSCDELNSILIELEERINSRQTELKKELKSKYDDQSSRTKILKSVNTIVENNIAIIRGDLENISQNLSSDDPNTILNSINSLETTSHELTSLEKYSFEYIELRKSVEKDNDKINYLRNIVRENEQKRKEHKPFSIIYTIFFFIGSEFIILPIWAGFRITESFALPLIIGLIVGILGSLIIGPDSEYIDAQTTINKSRQEIQQLKDSITKKKAIMDTVDIVSFMNIYKNVK